MTILFEDGPLQINTIRRPDVDYVIDAKDGYSYNMDCLRTIEKHINSQTEVVYTNFTGALNFGWDELQHIHRVYLRTDHGIETDFIGVQELTSKELRAEHNIEKMYRVGAFTE